MHYLSVHDLVWINTTVTGKTIPFNYEKLEAIMASQYGYGNSKDTVGQAAVMLDTALTKPAFDFGNRRTAFIALCAFLNANGCLLKADDRQAVEIFLRAANKQIPASNAIADLSQPADITLRPGFTLRTLVTHLCNEHTEALKLLTVGDE